jgi:hypothetical protein
VPDRDLEVLSHEEERRSEALGRVCTHALVWPWFGKRSAQNPRGAGLVSFVAME